jgi:hypothetical protein
MERATSPQPSGQGGAHHRETKGTFVCGKSCRSYEGKPLNTAMITIVLVFLIISCCLNHYNLSKLIPQSTLEGMKRGILVFTGDCARRASCLVYVERAQPDQFEEKFEE